MKNLLTILFAAITFTGFAQNFYASNGYTQSYTTVTKSCGSCGGAVSSNSCVGMTCPHCHVRWGYENTSRSTSYSTKTIPSSGSASTTASANLRTGPSTNYSVVCTMPAYTSLSILDKSGNWVKVSYSDYSGYYGSTTKTGWVSASLLDF